MPVVAMAGGRPRSVGDDRPGHPRDGGDRTDRAELLTLAVAQLLREVRSENRRQRFVPRALPGAFLCLLGGSGYNERLRGALSLIKRLIMGVGAFGGGHRG